MDAAYSLSFQSLQDACEILVNNQCTINGNCKGCIKQRDCRSDYKERIIDAVLHMDETASRFPLLLSLAQKHPYFLYNIPAFVYEKAYGSYHAPLPCPFQSEEISQHLSELEDVYSLLGDSESKLTLINIFMYRLTFQREYILRAYCAEPQYFIAPFRSLGADEVYVDCGAFTGDTFESYCGFNQIPKAAYLFEPDESVAHKMEPVLNKYDGRCRVQVIKEGLYRKTGQLNFVISKAAESYFSEQEVKNGFPVPVTSIDDAVSEDVSFIKMDIEGSELNALIGAKKHILNTYPKMAICVYHRPSDLWRIPLLIRDEYPGYTHFELRHHSRFFAETVLYVYR